MVCKEEEIFDWFKGTPSWKKINFLCRFLRMCHPVELRFIGSYVEQLAKKDFHALRDAELKFNDPADLRRYISADFDSETLSKVVIAISLLYSTNRTSAHIIYDTLMNAFNQVMLCSSDELCKDDESSCLHSEPSRMSNKCNRTSCCHSEITIDNLVLSLTLALHHPAFTFAEQMNLQGCLDRVEKYLAKRDKVRLL